MRGAPTISSSFSRGWRTSRPVATTLVAVTFFPPILLPVLAAIPSRKCPNENKDDGDEQNNGAKDCQPKIPGNLDNTFDNMNFHVHLSS
jgi:hypothetical protein